MNRLRTRRGPALALSLLLLVGAAACGSDDDSDDAAGDEAGGAVSEDTTTTEAEATDETVTTVAGDAGDTGGDVGDLAAGPNYESGGGPSGAGCSPGEVDTLPEGWWAGLIIEGEGTTVQFDLLCFFTGDGAVTAAEEDGNTAENDYYVRNQNERTFPVEFASTDVPATCVGTDAMTYDCTVGEIIDQHQPGGETVFPIVWLHVTGDQPDYLFTQYTP
jgi:hypothetical protein